MRYATRRRLMRAGRTAALALLLAAGAISLLALVVVLAGWIVYLLSLLGL